MTEKEGHANFAADMDVQVQRTLMKELNMLLSGAAFICEEQENGKISDEETWSADPVDGTANLIRHNRHSAVLVALMKNREPVPACVCNPFPQELFSAEQGSVQQDLFERVCQRNFRFARLEIARTDSQGRMRIENRCPPYAFVM